MRVKRHAKVTHSGGLGPHRLPVCPDRQRVMHAVDGAGIAYMLWSFVHGQSFLTIDMKHKVASAEIDEWDHLLTLSRAVLVSAVQA